MEDLKVVHANDVHLVSDNITFFTFGEQIFFPILYVEARGCAFTESRSYHWQKIADAAGPAPSQGHRNNYIQLRPEPKNEYDKNAIAVMCRGEGYGTIGYIAKEQTNFVREFAQAMSRKIKELNVTLLVKPEEGQKTIPLVVWP